MRFRDHTKDYFFRVSFFEIFFCFCVTFFFIFCNFYIFLHFFCFFLKKRAKNEQNFNFLEKKRIIFGKNGLFLQNYLSREHGDKKSLKTLYGDSHGVKKNKKEYFFALDLHVDRKLKMIILFFYFSRNLNFSFFFNLYSIKRFQKITVSSPRYVKKKYVPKKFFLLVFCPIFLLVFCPIF